MTKDPTQERSDAALAPLAEYVRANRGSMAYVCSELSRMTGRRQYPGNIRQWLFPDYCQRAEPRLGVGLMLLEIYRKMSGTAEPVAPKAGKKPRKAAPKKE